MLVPIACRRRWLYLLPDESLDPARRRPETVAVTGIDSPLTATTFPSKAPHESKLGSVLTPPAKPHADIQRALTTSYDICRLIDSVTLCHSLHNQTGWDTQTADSRWDRQPIHGGDLLKRSPAKITAQLRCRPCWLSLGSTVHLRRRLPEAHLHQNQSSAVPAPETKSNVDAPRRPAGVVSAQRARISALSSTVPPSVTSCAPSKMAHSRCWPSLVSTAHSRRQLPEAQPLPIKARLRHHPGL